MITSSLKEITPPAEAPTDWILPGMLPVGALALLEGGAGVGKTLVMAAYIADLCNERETGTAALVLTASSRAAEHAATHLTRQGVDLGRIKAIHWTATARGLDGKK